jgi:hypothetical protein
MVVHYCAGCNFNIQSLNNRPEAGSDNWSHVIINEKRWAA